MMLSYFSIDEDLKLIDDWNLDAIEVTLFDIVNPHLRCFHKATDVDARSPQRRTPILPDEAAQAEQSDIVCIMNVQTTQVSRFKATVDYLNICPLLQQLLPIQLRPFSPSTAQ